MRLNSIRPAVGAKTNAKRRGRGPGSGLGKTGGRGHKGQLSRSGGKVLRGFEGGQMPIHRRLPKFGFTAYVSNFRASVRTSELMKVANMSEFAGQTIDLDALKKADIVGSLVRSAKVFLSGDLDKAITVKGLRVSKGAKSAIEAAGGKVED